MSENSKKVNSVENKGKMKALKNEFNKIMWPDKKTVINKSTAVVITVTILGFVIAGIDYLINFGLTKLLG